MTALATLINPRDPAYLENRSTMLERLADLETALEAARAGGGEKWVTRHHARGKLLPRERVEMLLDQDCPFLELSPVAAWGSEFPVGASVVTGIGVVEGVECVIVANDPTIEAGALNPYTAEKIRRAARIAAINRLPMVHLVESAGASLPATPAPSSGGAIALDLSRLTAARVPTVCVVFGETTGEAAYLPALSDYTIMVRGHARALNAHRQAARTTGTNGHPVADPPSGPVTPMGPADQLAEDERDGLRLARQCVRRFNWRKRGPAPRTSPPGPPRFDVEDLLTIAGLGSTDSFDPREILARILDDSDFDEFKPSSGPSLVAGWGELHGYPLGVVANVGGGFSAADMQKAVHFIQLANATDTSLLFVQHAAGFSDDPAMSTEGQAGAPLVHAVAASRVPHLALSIGAPASVTAEGIHGGAYAPRFLFSWPYGQTGPSPESPSLIGQPGAVPDDGVIDPRDTRTVLGLCLSAIHSAAVEGAGHLGVFRT